MTVPDFQSLCGLDPAARRSIAGMTDPIDAERQRLEEIFHQTGSRILKSNFIPDTVPYAVVQYGPVNGAYFQVTIQQLATVGVRA